MVSTVMDYFQLIGAENQDEIKHGAQVQQNFHAAVAIELRTVMVLHFIFLFCQSRLSSIAMEIDSVSKASRDVTITAEPVLETCPNHSLS